ncbi:hypothetical protein [Piscirickettsia litoralis]|uniref:Uncharacterized protein n=1 Tax=Piscirickettsia litoralis TaxID=1891921 RepID=A0ABX3A737_9GAMM|nr:hypothetical protein [Piscirickettsia litoralis]ODN43255.1 hypothetical protein BGC07_10415 [Piscirickettsia litoralis]
MTRQELINELNKKGIPQDMYTFDEEYPHDKFVLFFNNKQWNVYYCEKGIKFDEKSFLSEKHAYSYLLSLL